ncbi:MAG TPA: MlaD family protein, partial [Gemmatimonadaceae bacterium]|nr:MlaD family protein [Gemmatimonadaceae bacterium]
MKRTNDFLVGLTVLVGAAIIVVASVWATGRRPGDDQRQLIVRVREVGNTRVGNAVVIRGVQAGRIDGIELAAGGWVYLRLAMQEEVDLPRDPVVILNQTSL